MSFKHLIILHLERLKNSQKRMLVSFFRSWSAFALKSKRNGTVSKILVFFRKVNKLSIMLFQRVKMKFIPVVEERLTLNILHGVRGVDSDFFENLLDEAFKNITTVWDFWETITKNVITATKLQFSNLLVVPIVTIASSISQLAPKFNRMQKNRCKRTPNARFFEVLNLLSH